MKKKQQKNDIEKILLESIYDFMDNFDIKEIKIGKNKITNKRGKNKSGKIEK